MEIYGIDFSGARKAGRKIWLSRAEIQGKNLVVCDCFRGADLPDSGEELESCLAALRTFIESKIDCTFGIDFPFGLPRKILMGLGFDTWENFISGFTVKFNQPDKFKALCWENAGNSELKRTTDIKSKTPHSPYNLRMFKGTFYGIAGILNPLVKAGKARILPMQRYEAGKTVVIEICPASTLREEDIYQPYKKGREKNNSPIADNKRNNRSSILNYLENKGVIISSACIENKIINDNEGDVLDCIIAAYATFKAINNPKFTNPDGRKIDYMLEGYVYV